jgi:hypothetical protein
MHEFEMRERLANAYNLIKSISGGCSDETRPTVDHVLDILDASFPDLADWVVDLNAERERERLRVQAEAQVAS